MSHDESAKIVNMITNHYPSFKFSNEIIDEFYNILSHYEYNYVFNKLILLLSSAKFQFMPPTVYFIVDGLPNIESKKTIENCIVYCNFCHKSFKNYYDEIKHEDRCRSVKYIQKQTRKWFKKEINLKEWYEMDEETFNERYNKLLTYIQNNTKDIKEKEIIEYIFNPPNPEKAKIFIKSNI